MAVLKSAKKALRQNIRRRAKNLIKRNKAKKLLKEMNFLISQKKMEEARKLLPVVYKTLDKAAKANLFKKNTASRKKSQLAKALTKARQ